MESVLAVSYMLAFLWVPILCQKWPKNDFVKPIGAYLRDIMFSFQAILSGTQWFSCETTGECDCIALLQRSSVCVVVLSNEACLPSSRVSAIQTPAPRWQPQSSGSFSVLLTRHLKRPVPFTALPFLVIVIFMWQKMEWTCFFLLCPQCPAIDYTRHTLDGAACLLNSNKYFPSRSVEIWQGCPSLL